MNDLRSASCCFTGHRQIPRSLFPVLQRFLEESLSALIARGVTNFLAGGALGFDTLAAETVLRFRERHPQIRLALILPCKDQEKGWSAENALRYRRILALADEVSYVTEQYAAGCMHKRNRRLVQNSAVCVCYLEKTSGGTFYTVNYAKEQGLELFCFPPDEAAQLKLGDLGL